MSYGMLWISSCQLSQLSQLQLVIQCQFNSNELVMQFQLLANDASELHLDPKRLQLCCGAYAKIAKG